MTTTLFAYYHSVPLHDPMDEMKLLTVWRNYHVGHGFRVVVLQQWDAWKHPLWEAFNARVSKLPSINPPGYDLACFHRWLAMAVAAGDGRAIMMDYDCYLTPCVDDDLNPLLYPEEAGDKLIVYQNTTPCLVVGNGRQFTEACEWFMAEPVRPEAKHISDMTMLEQIAGSRPEAFRRFSFAKCYSEEGWRTAPAIHFSNSCMGPNGKFPRWRWIPELLKEHSSTQSLV